MKVNNPNYLNGLGSSASEIDGKVIPIDTIALLRAKILTPSTVWVSGYYAKGDGAFGSNIFEWDSASVEADNGGTIIKLTSIATGRYKLKFNGAVNVKWFGAIPYTDYNVAVNSYSAFKATFLAHTNILIDDVYMVYNNESKKGIQIRTGTNIAGTGTVDISKQINDFGWQTSLFEIDNQNDINISGITFQHGASRPEAVALRGDASGIGIGKRSLTDNSSRIRINNCKFLDIAYGGIVAEVSSSNNQHTWEISDNYFEILSPNNGLETTGAQYAWDIINTHPFSVSSVKNCFISNNVIILGNHSLGGGTAYKCSGLENSIVSKNIIHNNLTADATTSSGVIEITMKNSIFENNNIPRIGVNKRPVFAGCEKLKIKCCNFDYGVTLQGRGWRDLSIPTINKDIIFLDCYFKDISYFTGVNIDSNPYGSDDVIFKNCTIENRIIFDTNVNRVVFDGCDLTISQVDAITRTISFNNCRFYNSYIGSSGIKLISGIYNNCIFHAGESQTGNYIVNPGNNAVIMTCNFTCITKTGVVKSVISGGISPYGTCEIYGEISNFILSNRQYLIYDISGYAKSNLNIKIPTTNSYNRYERIINFNAYQTGDIIGWVCTTSGSPGTWKSLGTLA